VCEEKGEVMSVKSKVKRLNREIKRLNQEIGRLSYLNNAKPMKEQLYENIIKFAITNHVGGLRADIAIDRHSVDKLDDLEIEVIHEPMTCTYIVRIR